MGKFPVSKEKELALINLMEALGIKESDLIENFILARGKGGQKVNKTSSCVQLRHLPSQTVVKCQTYRSQALNRYHARRELAEKIEQKIYKLESKKTQEYEKIRRQKRKRNKRAKEKMLTDKKKRAKVKKLRSKQLEQY